MDLSLNLLYLASKLFDSKSLERQCIYTKNRKAWLQLSVVKCGVGIG